MSHGGDDDAHTKLYVGVDLNSDGNRELYFMGKNLSLQKLTIVAVMVVMVVALVVAFGLQ